MMTPILESSPFLEETTQFVLSSPIALTFIDSLAFVESVDDTIPLLLSMMSDIIEWQKEGPAVRERRQLILTKLWEEGLLDEFEKLIQCHCRLDPSTHIFFWGQDLLTNLGGNARWRPKFGVLGGEPRWRGDAMQTTVGRGQECERRMSVVSFHPGSVAVSSSRLARLPPTPLAGRPSHLHTLIHVGHLFCFGSQIDSLNAHSTQLQTHIVR
ncbi:hypothetical protein BLNAU_18337 [Blattamonas nauphoetae]|uniref:Uncharacterized protein n=1 Tax=Blattamonas nauphoetae TaxID=2049346 RepID=A0ABQ9X4N7_9EUKA|nr:hypothetical protein BLNAU_18337 [Blattamonas nauphoetae]